MLIVGFAVLAIGLLPQTPRPSDEAMLALVAERVPGAVVLEAHDRPMPEGLPGAKGLCGIALIDGERQPFFVYTAWRPVDAIQGNRWSTAMRAPRSGASVVSDNFERRAVRTACPDLPWPAGVGWPTVMPAEGVVARSTDQIGADGQIVR